MPVRPPQSLGARTRSANLLAVFEQEVVQERAAALGDAGRKLDAALTALAAAGEGADADSHAVLVARAGDMLWRYLVQREACGLRDGEAVMRHYRVPAEVRRRMGIMTPQK
jgi:hypothetical protein